MERQFTPQYLDMDPGARALKTRIANLEQQLENERGKSQLDALVAAKEELASARATTRRLNQQMTDDKQSVQIFSRRMAEFQVMQEELRGLEQMRLAARQRLLGLEASETARKPRIQVLESAVMPDTAWRPLYWRDAGISLAASLALGFLAVWFVEFFNRPESAPTEPSTVIIPQPWVSVPHAGPAPQIGATNSPASLASSAQTSLLPSPQSRELSDDEVRKLLMNATPENLPLLVCMLFGLTTAEVSSLRVSHVDTVADTMTIPGEPPRTLRLEGPLRDLTAHGAGLAGDAVLFPSALWRAAFGGRPGFDRDIQRARRQPWERPRSLPQRPQAHLPGISGQAGPSIQRPRQDRRSHSLRTIERACVACTRVQACWARRGQSCPASRG